MLNKIPSRIKRLFTVNIGLKLIALVSAALLWLLVVNIDDPTQSRNFTATVTVTNEDVLSGAGKYYKLTNGNTVTFRVTARRKIIEDLSSSDFTATADMNYLEDDVRVPIEIEATRHASQITISSKMHYLTVSVGEEGQQTFTVKGKTTGNPASGYAVGDVTVSPEVISVSGPADIISEIEEVVATCDITDTTKEVAQTVTPRFYNAEGQEVDTTELTLSARSVKMRVAIESVHEVTIAVDTSGKLGEGLELDSITTNPSSIRVRGDSETLNSLTTITIPGKVIDLSTVTEDMETTVDIASYLPEGVSLASGQESQVVISVKIIKQETKNFSIQTNNLTVTNLEEGLTATFSKSTITVAITGLPSKLETLSEDDITGSVDVSGLTEGTHTVSVTLALDDDLSVATVTAEITLVGEQPAENEGENDG